MISEREIMRYEEYIKTQFKKLDESSLIREDKIPDLDLSGGKSVITKAMINNYTKNELIPRPEGKNIQSLIF